MAKVMGKVILRGPRLSFDNIFEPAEEEKDDGTVVSVWKTNFLFPKDAAAREKLGISAKHDGKTMDILAALKLAGAEAMVRKYGDDVKKHPKIVGDRKYLRDGDTKEYEGYPDNYYFTAKAKLAERPSILTNRKDASDEWIEATPGGKNSPYAGAQVNAIISIWIMDHKKYGKRMCVSLHSVQFLKDGEPFRAKVANPNDDFTDEMIGEEGSIGDDFDGDDDDGDDLV